jgi:hypothetical protein
MMKLGSVTGLALVGILVGLMGCSREVRPRAPLEPDAVGLRPSAGLIVRLSPSRADAEDFTAVARQVLEREGAIVLEPDDPTVPDVTATMSAVPRAVGDMLRVTIALSGTAWGHAVPPLALAYASATGDPDEAMVALLWDGFRSNLHEEPELETRVSDP